MTGNNAADSPVKTVELRRHTDNDGDRLSAEGVSAAEQIARQLTPPYDVFVSTGAGRATQAAQIWRAVVCSEGPAGGARGPALGAGGPLARGLPGGGQRRDRPDA